MESGILSVAAIEKRLVSTVQNAAEKYRGYWEKQKKK